MKEKTIKKIGVAAALTVTVGMNTLLAKNLIEVYSLKKKLINLVEQVEITSGNDLFLRLDKAYEKNKIENLHEFYQQHFNVLEDKTGIYEDIQFIYAANAYQKAKHLKKDTLIKELTTLYEESKTPRGMGDKEFQNFFGNLISTLNEDENVYEIYHNLADYVVKSFYKSNQKVLKKTNV